MTVPEKPTPDSSRAAQQPQELRNKLTALGRKLLESRRQLLRARVIIALLLFGTAVPCWWLAHEARETNLTVIVVGVFIGLVISSPAWVYSLYSLFRGRKERVELANDISELKESKEQLADTLKQVLANDDSRGGLAVAEGGVPTADGALSVASESEGALSTVLESHRASQSEEHH